MKNTTLIPTTQKLMQIKQELKTDENKTKRNLLTAKDIFAMEFNPDEKWLIERFLVPQGIMVLSGDPKTYKTWVSLHVAYCVANGMPVFDNFDTDQGDVLIINEENSIRLLIERLKMMNLDDEKIHIYTFEGIKADNKKDIEHIVDLIKKYHIKLVIFDSFIRVHSQEENDASQMRNVFVGIQPILKMNASVIFIHHHRKEGINTGGKYSLRGSSEIAAFISSHFLIRSTSEKGVVRIKNELMRDDENLDELTVRVFKDSEPVFELIEGQDAVAIKADKHEKTVLNIINESEEKLDIEQIKKSLSEKGVSMGNNRLRKYLNNLLGEGFVKPEIGDHNKQFYLKIPAS